MSSRSRSDLERTPTAGGYAMNPHVDVGRPTDQHSSLNDLRPASPRVAVLVVAPCEQTVNI
jgi:hypothetical protein